MPSHGYDSSSAVPVAGELPSDENIGDELHKLWDTMNFDVKARCEVFRIGIHGLHTEPFSGFA